MVLIPALLSGLPASMLRIAAYVLTALALYTIARRRCIKHPWLAWVPVVNLWLLGSLSDQYRYVVKGQVKSKRKVLLFLQILTICLSVSLLVLAVAVGIKGYQSTMYGMRGDRILEDLMGLLLSMVGIGLPLAGVAIAAAVIRYAALYDIYTSCDPDNNVLFTVLSILFGFTEPFFLFFSRNKDGGMPPRRETAEHSRYEAQPETWEEPDML